MRVEAQPSARHTVGEIRHAILETQRRIDSIWVVYRSRHRKNVASGIEEFFHNELAVKAPYFVFHRSGHGSPSFDWHDDPLRQAVHVNESVVYSDFPVSRKFIVQQLDRAHTLPGSLEYEIVFLATGIWPLTGRQPIRPEGRPFVLREIAGDQDIKWRLRKDLEDVEGRWCYVAEVNGDQTLWLDAEREFTLCRREVFTPQDSYLMRRYDLSEQRELAGGIWFPMRIRNRQYDYKASTEKGRKRAVIDGLVEVLEVTINDVSNEVFQFHPLPGALKYMGLRTTPVQMAGGEDHLDNLVSWLRRHPPR